MVYKVINGGYKVQPTPISISVSMFVSSSIMVIGMISIAKLVVSYV